METLTLDQSTIRGIVLGKSVLCMVRASPAGLQLPPGNYWLRPAENNPVYGQVMSIEPLAGASGEPVMIKSNPPSAFDLRPPSQKWDLSPASSERVKAPAAVATLGMPSAVKFSPSSMKVAPSMKFDSAAGGLAQSVVLSDRSIAGNCFVVTLGFADLIDVVQRAGGIKLAVV